MLLTGLLADSCSATFPVHPSPTCLRMALPIAGPPTLTNNQENAPQDMPMGRSNGVNPAIEVPSSQQNLDITATKNNEFWMTKWSSLKTLFFFTHQVISI